jgi:transposase
MGCTSNDDSAEQRNVAGCENTNLKYSCDRKLDVTFESDAIVDITHEEGLKYHRCMQ